MGEVQPLEEQGEEERKKEERPHPDGASGTKTEVEVLAENHVTILVTRDN